MKKILLIVISFCSIAFVSHAQLTTPTFPYHIFNITTQPTATTPAVFTATGGPIIYISKSQTQSGFIPKWQIVTQPQPTSYPTLWAESSYNTDLLPPCNDFWKQGNSYIQIVFTGTGCIQLPISMVGNSSVTTSVNGIIYPVFTSNQILTIPNPVVGLTVFDYSKGYLRTWNGSQWMPL